MSEPQPDEQTKPEPSDQEPSPPEPKPEVAVDAQPGQFPSPGSFLATGTVSPDSSDDSWWQAPRESWDLSAPSGDPRSD